MGPRTRSSWLGEARGEYFKYAAHDDLYAPTLLERCVAVLDEHPEVVLCHGDMAFIDADGRIIHHYDYRMATDSPSAPERFRSLLVTDGGDDEYGVMRTKVLRRVRPEGSFYNAGRPFVAEIALNGPFHQVRELLYFRRDHPARGDRTPSIPALCARLDPRRTGQTTVRLVAEYLLGFVLAILRAPISLPDRIRCFRHLASWLGSRVGVGMKRPAEVALPGAAPAGAGAGTIALDEPA